MVDPFVAGLIAIHASPLGADAEYQRGAGPIVPLRVIRSQPDSAMSIGQGQIVTGSDTFSIMRMDVDEPLADDVVTLTASSEVFTIVGEPMLDVEGLTWLCEAVPA